MSQPPTRQITPPRTAEQRRQALEQANRVRCERAALKAALRRREIALEDLLSGPPAALASARVSNLLLALPHYGPVKVARLLESAKVSPAKTIAGLTERQRHALLSLLGR